MAQEKEILEKVSTPEEVVEKDTKGKKCFLLSTNAMRWICFGISMIFVVLSALLLLFKVTKPIEIMGVQGSLFSLKDFIVNLIELITNGEGFELKEGFAHIFVALSLVYLAVGIIITAIYFIIMLVRVLLMLKKPKDDKDLEKRFNKVERVFVKFFAFYLIFDMFILCFGGVTAPSFALEAVMVALVLVGNGTYYAFRKQLESGEKFNVSDFVYEMVETVVVFLTLFILYFGLIRERFLLTSSERMIEMTKYVGKSAPNIMGFVTLLSGMITKLVGFFIALSMVRRVVCFYPYGSKSKEKGKTKKVDEAYSIKGILGKSISALVLYVIAGVSYYVGGHYSSIGQVIKSGPLVLIAVMGAAIALRVSRHAHSPNKEKVEELKSEEKVEEKPKEA